MACFWRLLGLDARNHPCSGAPITGYKYGARWYFLGRPEDAQWLFESGGAKRLFPDYYQQFLQALPQSIHSNIVTGAPRIMTGDDPDVVMTGARAWSLRGIRCAMPQPDRANTDDLSC